MLSRATLELRGFEQRRRAIQIHRAPDQPGSGSADARTSAARGPSPPQHEISILIVDDDPLMTDLLPRKLQRAMREGVRILAARTPAEASAILRAQRPAIVISDFNLRASENGLDVLAQAARERPEGARILFSGHTRYEIGAPLVDADIHGYVEKPMRLDDLVERLLASIRDATGVDLAREGARSE